MFCMVPDAQSFPFAAENRSHPDRRGDKTSSDRLCHLKVKGIHIDRIAGRVAEIMSIDPAEDWAAGKQHKVVQARSLLCYWTTSELGLVRHD